MNVTAALVELVREALKDPSVRTEIGAIVSEEQPVPSGPKEDEALIDVQAAGKLLGMSAVAVRTAAYRGTPVRPLLGRELRHAHQKRELPPSNLRTRQLDDEVRARGLGRLHVDDAAVSVGDLLGDVEA